MPRFILHIGLEKTGTTSIQRFLNTNRALLLERHGILYPHHPSLRREDSHPLLPASLLPDANCEFIPSACRPDPARVRSALQRLAGSDADAILLSAEHLSSRLDAPAIEQLGSWLQPRRVEIIVYLRRQDEMALSSFSTALRCGRRTWFRPRDVAASDRYFAYDALLAPWTATFGQENIRIRLFDQDRFSGGDLITDFMAAIGVSKVQDWPRPAPQNQSLNLAEASLLRLVNCRLPTWEEAVRRGRPQEYQQAQRMRARLLAEIGKVPAIAQASPLSRLLSGRERQQILERFAESNSRLARAYLGSDRLFDSPAQETRIADRSPNWSQGQVDSEQLAEIILAMASHIDSLDQPFPGFQLLRTARGLARELWMPLGASSA